MLPVLTENRRRKTFHWCHLALKFSNSDGSDGNGLLKAYIFSMEGKMAAGALGAQGTMREMWVGHVTRSWLYLSLAKKKIILVSVTVKILVTTVNSGKLSDYTKYNSGFLFQRTQTHLNSFHRKCKHLKWMFVRWSLERENKICSQAKIEFKATPSTPHAELADWSPNRFAIGSRGMHELSG